MNTPTHVAASLLLWQGKHSPREVVAVIAGAILPDAAMFGFYAYQRVWSNQPEAVIWSTLYHLDSWQLVFNLFNSFPIAIYFLLICIWRKWNLGTLFFGSILLHLLCDLPLHHDDAHRHFLPLSTWKFESPVSYWDPHHYGHIFAPLEMLFAFGSCLYLMVRSPSRAIKIAAGTVFTLGLAFLVFALVVWKWNLLST